MDVVWVPSIYRLQKYVVAIRQIFGAFLKIRTMSAFKRVLCWNFIKGFSVVFLVPSVNAV